MKTGQRIEALLAEKGWSQAELGRRVGVSQQSIWKLINGETQTSRHLHKIARELDTTAEYLVGDVDDPTLSVGESRLAVRGQEDALAERNLVPVQELDLSYGMGGTFLDVPVTEEMRYFPRDWLRRYTRAKPEEIFFAQGIGDSMFPTIADSDTLLIDTSQKSVSMADRIWAIAWGEVGMIKRLRPLGEELHILSDNASVPPAIAADGEVTVIGRVVAMVRKI